jgi:hypothetical protein
MLTTDQINNLYRLYWSEHWPIRKIERHLRMSWRTVKKYLHTPAHSREHFRRLQPQCNFQSPRILPAFSR